MSDWQQTKEYFSMSDWQQIKEYLRTNHQDNKLLQKVLDWCEERSKTFPDEIVGCVLPVEDGILVDIYEEKELVFTGEFYPGKTEYTTWKNGEVASLCMCESILTR